VEVNTISLHGHLHADGLTVMTEPLDRPCDPAFVYTFALLAINPDTNHKFRLLA
jgi:hypothetical protein